MTTDLVPVCVGACLCPGAPHADGDFVYLRPKLGLAAGIAVQKLVIDAKTAESPATEAELHGTLAEAYLIYGVADWTLTNGSAIPVTPDNIREYLLSDFERSEAAADAADDLYMNPVLAPLLRKAKKLSQAMSKNGSTSATPTGSPKRRKRSKPSSTSTTPTDDTATTSP